MDSSKKALLFGAGLFLTIALITLFVIIYSTASDASKAAQNEFSGLQSELAEQTYLVYDNTKVSGSQVVNAIRKFQGQNIGILVQTGKDPKLDGAGTWYINNASNIESLDSFSVGKLEDIVKERESFYINPSGTFTAKVERDSNQVIRAIKFSQQ